MSTNTEMLAHTDIRVLDITELDLVAGGQRKEEDAARYVEAAHKIIDSFMGMSLGRFWQGLISSGPASAPSGPPAEKHEQKTTIIIHNCDHCTINAH